MDYYVGIDIGGTTIKHGILDKGGHITEKGCMDTEAHLGGQGILEKVDNIIGCYSKAYPVKGVCISTAGMVDCDKGTIIFSGELIPNYTGVNFKSAVEQKYGVLCEVENDVNCTGLAEYRGGAAAGSRVALCLTVGTGIGGCILLNGQVFHGFCNAACEIGYMNMYGSDFQTLGASSILSKNVASRKSEKEHMWNGARIFENAGKGDTVCRQAIKEMARVLGEGIANICYVLNPEVVVIGGAVSVQEKILKPLIEEQLKIFLKPVLFDYTKLEFARQRNDAGILGAFHHFQLRQKQNNVYKMTN